MKNSYKTLMKEGVDNIVIKCYVLSIKYQLKGLIQSKRVLSSEYRRMIE